MGRKIILLSDGTGNSSAKVWRTNVWRTFEALDLSGNDQVAYYDDGVGTSSFKPLAILGGVFGFGLKRNVIALYKFACRNYKPGDDLYGFGFSRGAFTIRIVIGLMLSEGLVQAQTESELHRGAVDAYRAYRKRHFHTRWFFRPERLLRGIRDVAVAAWRTIIRVPLNPADTARHDFKIRFVGVWDTVAAYGMPIDEMTRGINNWIWPLGLPNHRFDRSRIERGCQALALDEERTTFHPELWNEKTTTPREIDITRPRTIRDEGEEVSQVWFTGVHSNVGGGYPDDSLAYIPFVWMIKEAQHCGLKFKSDYADDPLNATVMRADPDTFKNAISKRDKDGKLYDPRKGLGGYYRYGPRKLVLLNTPQFIRHEDDEIVVDRPKIHESVFKRIHNRAYAYAPIGLPPKYDIVTDDGRILTPDQYRNGDPQAESIDQASDRAVLQERVWNRVWWRKLVYYLTLAATFWLVVFPFVRDAEPNADAYSPFRWISGIIRFFAGWLPGFVSPWIERYAREPIVFLMSALIVAGLLWLGGLIAADISEKMNAIWQRQSLKPASWLDRGLQAFRNSNGYERFLYGVKVHFAPALFAFLVVYLGFCFSNKLAFVAYDSAGFTCVDAEKRPEFQGPRSVAKGDKTPANGPGVDAEFDIGNLCNRTRIALESGARYRVTIKAENRPDAQWRDASFDVPPGGFSSVQLKRSCPWLQQPGNHLIESASWPYRFVTFAGLPLRRVYTQDWFRLILRIGSEGAEEEYYRPDPNDCTIQWVIRAKRGGELFIYVNDAILGVPKLYDAFYQNNFGKGTVIVERL